jgi:hypothetical protein
MLENAIQRTTVDVGDKLYKGFIHAKKKLTTKIRPYVENCQAVFQADSVLAGRIVSGDTEIILTSDLDQAALLGSKCISIKKWVFRSSTKRRILESLEIFTAFESTMDFVLTTINLPSDTKSIMSLPKYPIFDNIECHRLRALLVVGLGCNVNLNPLTTPAKLLTFVKSENMKNVCDADLYFAIKKYYVSQHNKKSDKHAKRISKNNEVVSDNIIESQKLNVLIDFLTDAFIYEPTILSNVDRNNKYTYIYSAPPQNQLHPYLNEFLNNTNPNNIDTTVVNNDINDNNDNIINNTNNNNTNLLLSTNVVDCCVCVGTGDQSHLFLEAEGFSSCTGCGTVCCMQCISQNKKGENTFCYQCFLPEVSVKKKTLNLH